MPDALLLWKIGEDVAAVAIADADVHGLARVEHIELGQRDAVEAVDARRIPQCHRVHPAAPPRPTRHGAELVPPHAEQIGGRAVQLGRKRPASDPRAVGLRDAEHAVDLGGRHARARARAAGGRARGRDEGIGAVIEVQHGALGALEEQRGARVDPARQEERGVRDVGREPARVAPVRVEDRVHGEGLGVVDLPQEPVLLEDVELELLTEELLVEQVRHADADARRLVRIGRSHALAGGADAPLAGLGLTGAVQRRVIGHDEVGVLRDVEVAVEGDTASDQRLHLVDQRGRVDDHAAADDAPAARVEDAGGDRLEHELLLAHHDGVPGVVPALVADGHVDTGRQHVHHLPLALVAPLGADHDDVRHGHPPGGRPLKRAHLLRWRPRPHARRTESTPRVRPSGAASHLDPLERPAGL